MEGPASGGGADINVQGNKLSGWNYGIYLYIEEEGEDSLRADIQANVFLENEHGLCINAALSNPDSAVNIFNNLFHLNEHGIMVDDLTGASAGAVTAFLNSFTGNAKAGIANGMDGVTFNAPLNWWGSEAGPSTADKETGGDLVVGEVHCEPWLKELKLVTSGSILKDGGLNTVTAALLDSEGSVVDTGLLEALFTVTGANNYSEVVKLAGGVATFSYRDLSPGTDTISARLLFAGEAAGSYLASEAQTTWEAGSEEDEKPELPRTSSAALPIANLAGLACLIAGAALRARRRGDTDI